MTSDLKLSYIDFSSFPPTNNTSRLSWATSMFYFGMLAGLYPMVFALQRFNMGRILGGVVCFWALICMCTAAVKTWEGLYAQRFFLGFVESVVCLLSLLRVPPLGEGGDGILAPKPFMENAC
jgi:MFS family permease